MLWIDHDADVVDVEIEAEEKKQPGEILDAASGKFMPVGSQGANFQNASALLAQAAKFVGIEVVHGQAEIRAVAYHRGCGQYGALPLGHENRGLGEKVVPREQKFGRILPHVARVQVLAVQQSKGLQQFATAGRDLEFVCGLLGPG